jgi:hypothetical protein
MSFKKYLILILAIPLISFTLHKYYVSLCEIEYVENKKSVQIIFGVFIDDLEVVLNKEQGIRLNLATEKEPDTIDEIYQEFLHKNFKISINSEVKNYQYIGKEYDNDIVRFYLEIPNITKLKSIAVTNTSLFDNFDNQQNIIKIKIDKFNKTFYLNKKNNNCLLKI